MAEAGSGFERKARVRPAVAAAIAGIFLTLLAYFIAQGASLSAEQTSFERRADSIAAGLHATLQRVPDRLDALASVLFVKPDCTDAEFSAAARVSRALPGEVFVAWLPQVAATERAAFDAGLRMTDAQSVGLYEFDAKGFRIAAWNRPDFHPVARISPVELAPALRGLDAASISEILYAILRAREKRTAVVSALLQFPAFASETEKVWCVLRPVYDEKGAERGMLMVVLRPIQLLQDIVRSWLASGHLRVAMLGDGDDSQAPIWESGVSSGSDRRLRTAVIVEWGSRQWRFEIESTDAYPRASLLPLSSLVLLLGMIFTLCVSIVISFAISRGERMQAVMTTQTAALSREISAKLNAEAALREKQEEYQDLFENAPDLILSFDDLGKIAIANPACCKALGFAREDLVGRLLDGLIVVEDRGSFERLLAEVRSGGNPAFLSLALVSHSGSRILVEGDLSVRRVAGRLAGIRAIFRDVTERRRIEQELRRSQDNLSALVQNTQDAFWSVGRDGRLLTFNSTFADVYGELSGLTVKPGQEHLALVPDEHRSRWRALYERAMAGERLTVEQEERIGGQPRTFLVSLNPILSGGVVVGVTGYRKDVTEQEKLDRALRAIVEGAGTTVGEDYFRLLAQQLASALSTHHAFIAEVQSGPPLRVRTLGFFSGGRASPDVEFCVEQSAAAPYDRDTIHVPFGVSRLYPEDELLKGKQAEGYLAAPLRAGDGSLLGVLGVFHEQPLSVTQDTQTVLRIFAARAGTEIQRKRAERAMAQARDAAEDSARMKTEFLANMSHEIRTPINGIFGMTELLQGTQLSPEQSRFLRNIRACSELLKTLIDDILDFSRIEAGKLAIESVDFALPQTVGEAVNLFAKAAEAKGIKLNADVKDGVPATLRGDPLRLRQILINLIGNAVKFTAKGAVKVDIECVKSEPTHARLRFSVTDSGLGIDAEAQKRLFTPFVQADGSTTRKYGGTGLGLSICRRLVELMGGEIGVESEKGKGARFWFELRLERSQNSGSTNTRSMLLQSHALSPQPSPLLKEEDRYSARVLVVEDNPINQEVATGLLSRLGCRTDIAENGRVALECLAREVYDLVLMDCQMPVLDGYETTAEIRTLEQRHPERRRATVVAMTAHALPSEREKCLACGMDDYVAKPVTTEILKQLLVRWAGNAKDENRAWQPDPQSFKPVPGYIEPAADEDAPVLDLDRLREAGGNPAGMVRIANLCVGQLKSRMDSIRAAIAEKNFSEVIRLAHMSVGSCGACGMARMARVWRQAEASANASNGAEIEGHLKKLKDCLQEVEQAVAQLP